MSETAKVRGGVLEEIKGVDLDSISHKSDKEKIDNTVEKLSDEYEKNMNFSEKKMMEMSDGSESDVRSNISSSGRSERQRILRDRAETNRTRLINRDERWDSNSDEPVKNGQDFQNFPIYNAKNREKSEMEGFRRAQMIEDEVTGYTQAGPPNLVSRSNYAFENADFVGDDRAELLRKLDELTSQLNRSGNLIDKGKEKVPLDRRTAQSSPYGHSYADSSLDMNRPQVRRPYHNEYSEPPPLMHNGNGFYPPQYGVHTDPMRSHMLRRDSYDHQISNSRAYMHKDYINYGSVYMDNIEPYSSNFSRHHSSCPCYQCLNSRQAPPRVLQTGYSDNDKMFDYRVNSGSSFGTRDYTQRNPDPWPLRSRNAESHSRWPSDVDSEVDVVIRRRPGRMHLSSGSGGQYCRPIAGGAPFMTCYNCFELLMLPKKGLTKNNNKKKKKMRCGACSTVIVFVVSNKSLVISTAINKVDNNVVVPPSHDKTTFSSDDYGNNASDFRSIERAKTHHSASSYTSEVDEERESLAGPAKHSGPTDMSAKDKGHPLPAGSSLQDYFEHSNKYHLATRSENEKSLPLLDKITPRRKESSATEIDISSHEYYNTGTTLDSGEGSKEGDNLKGTRDESFFRKVSCKDSQRSIESLEHENANVTVNGHLIPHRLIKKAEKLAGPISPGNYWYDFRAGFWGVMGGPCLGIIPPFIGEFNYPMSDHCAGGNTRVYVNGRELNQKDLKLLGNRGLPTERDRSYIVEISGRVLDGDTGEELQSLGKLAPTLEKVKHGFGMRAPNSVTLK